MARLMLLALAGGALLYIIAPQAFAALSPGYTPGEEGDISGGGGLLADIEAAAVNAAGALIGATVGGWRVSAEGLEAIRQREGLRLNAYADGGGVATIGYGHALLPGEGYTRIDQATAERLLADDVAKAERVVNTLVSVPLTQGQVDALGSFAFSVGEKQFRTSTLRRLLNAGDYEGAAAQFARWVYDNGEYVPGLATRRDSEQAQFLG